MERDIVVIIKAKDRASAVINKTSKSFGALGKIATTAVGFAVGTVAVKGVGALIGQMRSGIDVAADFESQINILGIAARASGTGMDDLREASIKVGADTELVGINASQAADAITAMYKAGLDTTAIFGDLDGYLKGTTSLTGVLRAAVDLQAASELDLAQATDVVSVAMATFGMSEKDAIAIADSFIKTADASVAEVFDLTEAMRNVGPVAAQFGWSLQDVNTALAILSTRGIKGAEAGTSLRSMMTNLMRPTDNVTDALDELGVELYDAEGHMRSLPDIVKSLSAAFTGQMTVTRSVGGATKEQTKLLKQYQGEIDRANKALEEYRVGAKGASLTDKTRAKKMTELTKKVALYQKKKNQLNITEAKLVKTTKKLTEEQKNQYIQTLAGTYGMKAMNTLLAEGVEGWEGMAEAISEAATAQEVAEARTKGFRASMEQLHGVLESLWIRVGTPLIEKFLTPATKALADLLTMAMEAGAGIEGGLGEKLSGMGEKVIEWISPRVPGVMEKLDELLTAIAGWVGRVGIPKMVQLSTDFVGALFGIEKKTEWEKQTLESVEGVVQAIEKEIAPGIKMGMPLPPATLPQGWKRVALETASGTIDVLHKELSEGMAVGMPAPPPTLAELVAEGFKNIGSSAADAFVEGLQEGFAEIDWRRVWLTLSPLIMPTMPGGIAQRMFEFPEMEEMRKEAERKQKELGPQPHPLVEAFKGIWASLFSKETTEPILKNFRKFGVDMASKTIEGTEDELEIKSSSKVFKRIGEDMAEGMADGLKSPTSVWRVTDAIIRLVTESRFSALPTIQSTAWYTGRSFALHMATGVLDGSVIANLANSILSAWQRAAAIAAQSYRRYLVPPTPTGPTGPYGDLGPSFPGYQFGGTVPGPIGKPRMVMAHGGEQFLGAGARGRAGVTFDFRHARFYGVSQEFVEDLFEQHEVTQRLQGVRS